MDALFKVVSVYERFVDLQGTRSVVRVEVFRGVACEPLLRTRVWLKGMFNLYPAALNTDQFGNDIRSIHSAEEMNTELTSLITNDESYVFGRLCDDEEGFVDQVFEMVAFLLTSVGNRDT